MHESWNAADIARFYFIFYLKKGRERKKTIISIKTSKASIWGGLSEIDGIKISIQVNPTIDWTYFFRKRFSDFRLLQLLPYTGNEFIDSPGYSIRCGAFGYCWSLCSPLHTIIDHFIGVQKPFFNKNIIKIHRWDKYTENNRELISRILYASFKVILCYYFICCIGNRIKKH